MKLFQKDPRDKLRKALPGVARALRFPLIVLAVYLVLYGIFVISTGYSSASQGLLTPSGSPSPGLLALALVVLLLRLVALFVLPAVITYRLLRAVLFETKDKTDETEGKDAEQEL